MNQDGSVRGFVRLLYATFERVGGSAFGFGAKPNFVFASRLVITLITSNLLTAGSTLLAVADTYVKGLHIGKGVGIAAIAGMAVIAVWITSGIQDSPATTELRQVIDNEASDERRARRSKVALYTVASIALFVTSLLMLRSKYAK